MTVAEPPQKRGRAGTAGRSWRRSITSSPKLKESNVDLKKSKDDSAETHHKAGACVLL